MLSLAKLAAGRGASYWLQQAQGRVTHAQSVASAVEDYYLAGPEAAGRWTGCGARAFGLGGEVEPEALTRLLERNDPRTGEALPRPPGRPPTVPGYDLMFSVPKSASMLFALGGEREQAAVLRAQRAAVGEAMSYLERHACLVRRGAGGHIVERGAGLIGAAFEHRTSRAGDPQIHTHVLVANLARRGDGLWATLDGRAIYHQAKAAGHVHEAAFRRELACELGVEWSRTHNGIAELVGITAEQRAAFSRRATEIDAYMKEHGWSGPEARQIAAMRTREAKDYEVTPAELAPEWRERGAALGLDRAALAGVLDRGEFRALGANIRQAIAHELVGPRGLTLQASSFDRRDVVCAFACAAQQGAKREEIEAFVDRFLRDARVVPLLARETKADGTGGEIIRLGDGRVVPAPGRAGRYSTRALLALEQRVIERALSERDVRAGVADPAAVERALAARTTMGSDQVGMVRRLCADGDRVQVVVGPPGTGKTFALDAARDAWEASEYTVVGAAVARRAARRVQESAGIPSTSVAALQRELRLGGEYGLGPRTVVIVDEAGMLGTRDMHELVEHAARAGAKVVLVGDHHQLPEIDAGGSFRALAVRCDPVVLTENRRQREEWARRMPRRPRARGPGVGQRTRRSGRGPHARGRPNATRARLVAGDRDGSGRDDGRPPPI